MPKPLSIAVVGDKIVFHSDYTYLDLNLSVAAGKWDKTIAPVGGRTRPGAWIYPAKPDIAAAIMRAFDPVILSDDRSQVSPEFRALVPAQNSSQNFISKTKAWKHQVTAFNLALDAKRFMLALDMGTGKSKVAVDLVINWQCKLTVIFCPKSVVSVWPQQFQIHAGRPVDVLALEKGTVASKVNQCREFLAMSRMSGRPAVIVMNYESGWRETMAAFLLAAALDCVICDESHRIKTPSAKSSKFIARLGKKSLHRLCLTGTPTPHSPLDVYGQYRFLDPDIFGTNFQSFKMQYVSSMDAYGAPRPVKAKDPLSAYKNLPEFYHKFYSIAFRVKSGDVLDLPPVQHIDRCFDLSPAARKIYNKFESDLTAEIGEGRVNAANGAVKILRLAQIASGFAKLEDDTLVHVDNGARETLGDLLEDLPQEEPVVIFCRFHHDLDTVHQVAQALGREALELSGRKNQLAAWKAGVAPILAVQIQSGGAGVDCTRACQVIYFSVGHSLGDYEQSLKRCDRPGQTRPVRFYHIKANNTVLSEIYDALELKRDVVEYCLELRRRGKAA